MFIFPDREKTGNLQNKQYTKQNKIKHMFLHMEVTYLQHREKTGNLQNKQNTKQNKIKHMFLHMEVTYNTGKIWKLKKLKLGVNPPPLRQERRKL